MDRRDLDQPGLDLFWEQADADESSEHPIERELCDHLDALARYRQLIHDSIANGRDDAASILLRQHEREEQVVRRLHNAWRQLRASQRDAEQADDDRVSPSPEPTEHEPDPPEAGQHQADAA